MFPVRLRTWRNFIRSIFGRKRQGRFQPLRSVFPLLTHGAGLEERLVPATIFGVTNANQLISFNSATPGTIISNVSITGLVAGDNIVGMDFRPATEQLYGFSQTGRLYIIDTTTGSA